MDGVGRLGSAKENGEEKIKWVVDGWMDGWMDQWMDKDHADDIILPRHHLNRCFGTFTATQIPNSKAIDLKETRK